MHSFPYPPSPTNVSPTLLNPSAEFRSKVYDMVRNIVLFILLYLLLIAFGAGLLVLTGFLGVAVISVKVGLITLAAGLGLFALGIMFFIFLIKFIFSRNTEQDPSQIEIHEKDHPKLFGFIREVAREVKTDFPKKIFLTPDVNAAVFYNSSFWSMFFPVRKNLKIGLGLVNSLNVSEFKAALAHEFGHFSQRSMKVGSYVYTANKVIFNLVNERDRWDRTLEAWANAGGIFGFFASVTFFLVQRVRAILTWAYQKLSLGYMSLSREMEYHADLVACSVAGTEQLVSTLRKIEFTDSAYNYALSNLNTLVGKKKRSANLYEMHSLAVKGLAEEFKLPLKDGMPVLSAEELEKHRPLSRVNIKDQWASHPSREEREASVNVNPVRAEWVESPAWELFDNPEQTRRRMTEHVYALANPAFKDFEILNVNEFDQFLNDEKQRFKMPEVFKGFYDGRNLMEFNLKEEVNKKTDRAFEEFFSADTKAFFSRYQMNQSDLATLQSITQSDRKNDFFEYDNKKYQFKDASSLVTQLEKELDETRKSIQDLDMHSFRYFNERAASSGVAQDLVNSYEHLFGLQKKLNEVLAIANRFQEFLQSLSAKSHFNEEEVTSLTRVANEIEREFKRFLEDLPLSSIEDKLGDLSHLKSYAENKSRFFFSVGSLTEESIDNFSKGLFHVCGVMDDITFEARKKIAVMQEGMVPERQIKRENTVS